MGAGIKGSFPLKPAESTRDYGVGHASICRFSVRILWMTNITLITLGFLSGMGSQVFASGPLDSPGSVAIDVRWIPWIGSWRLVSNTVSTDDRDLRGDYRLEVSPTDSGNAVTMKTFNDDTVLFEDVVIADGISQPLKDKECSGWYKYSWSDTGKRLLFESESKCPDKPAQNISGISVMNRNGDWVDIQLLQSSQDRIITVRRYSLVSEQTEDFSGQGVGIAMAGRLKAGTNFSVNEIIELSGTVPQEVLEAAIMEYREPFSINSKTLQRLADADVPSPVIDLMVALSFPEKFYVERDTVSIMAAGDSGSGGADVVYSSPYYSPYYSRYSIVDPFFPWYWTPSTYALYWNYGWDMWPGLYYPYYYYGSSSSVGFQQRHDSGRLVAGQGYTRVRSRDSSSAPSGSAVRRSASGSRVSNVGSNSSSRSSARANSGVAPSGSAVSYGSSSGSSSGGVASSSGGGSVSSGSSGGSSSGGSSGYSGGGSPSASPGGYSGGGGSGGSAHSR
jgi:hypothetical protein